MSLLFLVLDIKFWVQKKVILMKVVSIFKTFTHEINQEGKFCCVKKK